MKSQKQSCVALSTAEAEYIALSNAAQESVWLRQLTSELGSITKTPTTIFEDNQSAIAMSKKPQFHGQAKHIDIKHHYIREQVNNRVVKIEYCPTEEMTADIFTKGMNREHFRNKGWNCQTTSLSQKVRRSVGYYTYHLYDLIRIVLYDCIT